MEEKEMRERVNEKHGYTQFNAVYDKLRKEWVSGQAYDTDKESLRRIAKRIHDTKPDYVFLTETAATPWGYFLKEVIRSAYPHDKIPLFYRVDSRRVQHYNEADKLDKNVKNKLRKFLKKRIAKKSSNIVIFDEFPHSRGTATSMKTALANYGLPEENITIITPDNYEMLPYEKLTEKDRSRPRWATGRKVKEKDVHFTGTTIIGNSGQILKYIHGAKTVGREIGEELHAELKNKKSLEQKVSAVVATAGLVSSLFFLGSSVTGNAIANMTTKTTSFLGAGFLIVGLVAGFFWVKNRK